MKFAIRDDDTCYYTTPEEIRRVYAAVWDTVPITIACVPSVSPDADVLTDIPSTATTRRSIAENDKLISFLRAQRQADHIEVALHGYEHALFDGEPEFVSAPNLTERIREGRQILENAVNQDVRIFVPPHAQLSRNGVRAIWRTNMDIGREYGPKPREIQPHPRWPLTYSKMVRFYYRYGHQYRYPKPLDYGTHREIYCHRLSNDTDFEWLTQAFEYVATHDGVFVLSMHAPELTEEGIEKLRAIVEHAKGRVEFTTLSDLLDH